MARSICQYNENWGLSISAGKIGYVANEWVKP